MHQSEPTSGGHRFLSIKTLFLQSNSCLLDALIFTRLVSEPIQFAAQSFQLKGILPPNPHLLPRRHLKNIWWHFWLSPLGKRMYCLRTDHTRDAATHPTMQGRPHDKAPQPLCWQDSKPGLSSLLPGLWSQGFSRAIHSSKLFQYSEPHYSKTHCTSLSAHSRLWRLLIKIKWDTVEAALSLSPPSTLSKKHLPPSCPARERRRLSFGPVRPNTVKQLVLITQINMLAHPLPEIPWKGLILHPWGLCFTYRNKGPGLENLRFFFLLLF